MIAIRNGRVVFTDAATKMVAALSRVNMRMKLSLPSASLNLRLTSGDLSITAPAYQEIKGKLRGKVDYDNGRLSLESLRL
jgi:hypothetical protein